MPLSHRTFVARLAEFREQRFGLVIHWGLYPPGTLTLQLPVRRPEGAVPVVEIFL